MKRTAEPGCGEEHTRSWMTIYIEEVTARWYVSRDSQQAPCIPFLCSISGCQEEQLQLLEVDVLTNYASEIHPSFQQQEWPASVSVPMCPSGG